MELKPAETMMQTAASSGQQFRTALQDRHAIRQPTNAIQPAMMNAHTAAKGSVQVQDIRSAETMMLIPALNGAQSRAVLQDRSAIRQLASATPPATMNVLTAV